MTDLPSTFQDAVEAQVSAPVAARFKEAAMAAAAGEDLDSRAGQALAVALCFAPQNIAFKQVEGLTLSAVELRCAGQAALLQPHEAHAHPLLKDWAADNFSGALALALQAGRLMTTVAAHAPNFDLFHLGEEPNGNVYALAQMTFQREQGDATAKFHFGGNSGARYAHASLLSGDAVFLIGVHVRDKAAQSLALDAATEASEAIGRGVLH